LKWTDPDEEGLVKFLCGSNMFSEDRVRNGAKKLLKAKSTSTQGRLDSFFTVVSSSPKRKVSLTWVPYLLDQRIDTEPISTPKTTSAAFAQ